MSLSPIETAVANFAAEPEEPSAILAVAEAYWALGQTGSAVAYYLRAAEFAYDSEPELAYAALLRLSDCLAHQRDREATVLQAIEHAVALCPERPEAWFYLSRYREREFKWAASYAAATMGLGCLGEHWPLPIATDYLGDFCLEFQQAVAGDNMGRRTESQEIMLRLSEQWLPEPYGSAVTRNLASLLPPPTVWELSERVARIRSLLALGTTRGVTYARFGSAGDGGYVLADDLQPTDWLISLGVDKNVDFEAALSPRIAGMDCYDNSVTALPQPIANAQFYPETVGSGEWGTVGLGTMLEVAHDYDDYLLKVDVEGAEFDLLTSHSLERFRQITIEFHRFDRIGEREYYRKVEETLSHLRRTHTPVLVHPNNDMPLNVIGHAPVPTVFEVLYLRTTDYKWAKQDSPFAGLTARNNVDLPEMGLSFP